MPLRKRTLLAIALLAPRSWSAPVWRGPRICKIANPAPGWPASTTSHSAAMLIAKPDAAALAARTETRLTALAPCGRGGRQYVEAPRDRRQTG